MTVLRLGTRRSVLARTQSGHVADALRARGHQVELVPVTTQGDQDTATPLRALGGTGVFVSALRDALRQGLIDCAVHSLKDLPTTDDTDLTIAAIPAREDSRDALIARDGLRLADLPAGAVIGTGSPRRRAQLLALGLGLQVAELRGNVDTRLASVLDGRHDAVVLAAAGLRRLGRAGEITDLLDPLVMLPAPGQGALAVECRSDDAATRALLTVLDCADTRAAVTAERALLAALEAGCSAPIGALADVVEGFDGPELSLRAVVAATDGSDTLRRSLTGPVSEPARLGQRLAAILLADGAGEVVPDLAARPSPHPPPPHPHPERAP